MTERLVIKIGNPRQQREVGGFLIRKVIGGLIPICDPFLMLDHIGPATHGPREAVGAPDHPHRGFDVVTYVIDGGVKHQDSAGHKGVLKSGWVQWMTAGSGLVHSEMPTDEIYQNGGNMEGFQLWVNLPAKFKMMEPAYQDVPPEQIPVTTTHDGKVSIKVIAGEALGAKAVIETQTQILFLDIHLRAGSAYSQSLAESYAGFAYVWSGAGFLGHDEKPVQMGEVGILGTQGTSFFMKADQEKDCHILLIAGEPIKEPVARYGPFVMNTQEEIKQAIDDYRSGKLGSIPGRDERMRQTEAALALQKKNIV